LGKGGGRVTLDFSLNSPSSPILSPDPHHQDTTSPHHHHQDTIHTTHSTIQAVSPGIPLGILPSFSHTAISESSPTTVTPALRIYETDDVGRRNRTQGEINVQLDKLESWAPCRDTCQNDVVPTEAIHQRAFLAAYNSLAASTKGMALPKELMNEPEPTGTELTPTSPEEEDEPLSAVTSERVKGGGGSGNESTDENVLKSQGTLTQRFRAEILRAGLLKPEAESMKTPVQSSRGGYSGRS